MHPPYSGYRLNEIASFLGVHYSTVSRRPKKQEERTRLQIDVSLQDLAPSAPRPFACVLYCVLPGIIPDTMKCFVIMPFGDPSRDPQVASRFSHIYEEWIAPTVSSIRIPGTDDFLQCSRADSTQQPGDIIEDIVEELATADLVIADLSTRNANVFYELGARHALRDGTILIADSLDAVPFDLRGLRTISYEFSLQGMAVFRKNLRSALEEVIRDGQRNDNPVRRYLYEKEIEKLVSGPLPPGFNMVEKLAIEVRDLREAFRNEIVGVRRMLGSLTAPVIAGSSAEARPFELEEVVEGMWRDDVGSLVCIKMLGHELRIPYCYGGSDELTAHYCNVRMAGKTLFGRFEWFDGSFRGYGYFTLCDDDHMEGAWWHAEDIPPALAANITLLETRGPRLNVNEHKLRRDKRRKRWPKWAKDYFDSISESI